MSKDLYSGILTTNNLIKIRKTWKQGKRVVTLQGTKYDLSLSNRKAYILVKGANGVVGQVEKEHYGALKTTDKEGNKIR